MGNHTSTSISETIDVVNETLTTAMTSTENSAVQNTRETQTLTVNIGVGANVLCTNGIAITQANQTTATLTSQFTSQDNTAILAQISAAIDAAASSNNSSVTGLMATKVADSSDDNVTIAEHLKNICATNIDTITQNTCVQSNLVVQNQTINILGNLSAASCNFGQNLQMYLVANCMSNSAIEIVNKDTTLSTNIANAAASQDSKANGVDTITGQITSALAGIFGDATIGYIVIVLALLAFVFLTYRYGGSTIAAIFGRGTPAPAEKGAETSEKSSTTSTSTPAATTARSNTTKTPIAA